MSVCNAVIHILASMTQIPISKSKLENRQMQDPVYEAIMVCMMIQG